MILPHGIRKAVVGMALFSSLALVGSATAGSEGEGEGKECAHGKYHGGHGKHGFGFGHFEKRVDALQLDDATKTQVIAILDQAREQRRARKDEFRAARQRMDDLLAKPDVTEAELMAQVDADAALHTEAHKAKLRTLLAIRGLLTPEQWESFRKHPGRGDGPHYEPETSS
jgi:Spy/CpxP family protein refolding chaperone